MAKVMPDALKLEGAGLNDFSILTAGGRTFLGLVAKGGNGGRLVVKELRDGVSPSFRQEWSLGDLGVTAALLCRLAVGPNGSLWAYISRDTDDPSGQRTYTPVDTEIAVGAQDDPVTPPAPPGGAVDLAPVIQAIAAARGPRDGKDADFNSVAGVKNTAEATYKKVVDETSAVLGVLDPLSQLAREAAREPGWLWQPPTRDYTLPEELAKNLATDYQQMLAFTVITLLEFLTNLPEFPRADGGTILRT